MISMDNEHSVGFQGWSGDQMRQRYPVEKLHGDEGLTILLADVVDSANVGVVQRGCSLGLALKTGEGLGIFGHIVRQEFEGDETMKPGVFSLINHSHTAAANFLDNAIVRDGLADHCAEYYVGEIGASMKRAEGA